MLRIYNVVVRNSLIGARVVILILGSDPNQVNFVVLLLFFLWGAFYLCFAGLMGN